MFSCGAEIHETKESTEGESVANGLPTDSVINEWDIVEHLKPLYPGNRQLFAENRRVGDLAIYELLLNKTGPNTYSFGTPSELNPVTKTVLLMGATGCGKSTLIDAFVNYLFGVKHSDPYRFTIVRQESEAKGSQTKSQTREVTVYNLYHMPGFLTDYSLTIVDTPGFGDTGGVEEDEKVVQRIKEAFSCEKGVQTINAVGLVVNAGLVRLTPTQKYIFNAVLSIFGADMRESILVMATFADRGTPIVLESIKECGVPCRQSTDGTPFCITFNNSCLFNLDAKARDYQAMFWNMCEESVKSLFNELEHMQPKSLTQTCEVLKERSRLEVVLCQILKNVKIGLAKIDKIRETRKQLDENSESIRRNKNYEGERVVTYFEKVKVAEGFYATQCLDCNMTCHDKCTYPNDESKKNCGTMDNKGYCVICPGGCFWDRHVNSMEVLVEKTRTEKFTYDEIKRAYEEECKKEMTLTDVLAKLEAEKKEYQDTLLADVKRISEINARLSELALRPNPLTTLEYVDLLMKAEKSSGEEGWQRRYDALAEMRKRAELLDKIERGRDLLLEN